MGFNVKGEIMLTLYLAVFSLSSGWFTYSTPDRRSTEKRPSGGSSAPGPVIL